MEYHLDVVVIAEEITIRVVFHSIDGSVGLFLGVFLVRRAPVNLDFDAVFFAEVARGIRRADTRGLEDRLRGSLKRFPSLLSRLRHFAIRFFSNLT